MSEKSEKRNLVYVIGHAGIGEHCCKLFTQDPSQHLKLGQLWVGHSEGISTHALSALQ